MNNDSKYELIIYWSEGDQAFIAEAPELAGCAADGATYSEALSPTFRSSSMNGSKPPRISGGPCQNQEAA